MSRGIAERLVIAGPAGNVEVAVDAPAQPRGIALVAHPHPMFGGTMDNKVAHTLARTFKDLGYAAVRSNFRGVGATEGVHDQGEGETEDLLAVLAWARGRFGEGPVVLAGFSFGAFVQARVAKRLADAGTPAQRLVLVGTAAGFVSGERRYETEAVAADTLVIHGERDDTVPLANVLDWARPMEQPVIVVPDADHFFHRRLHVIKAIITHAWRN